MQDQSGSRSPALAKRVQDLEAEHDWPRSLRDRYSRGTMPAESSRPCPGRGRRPRQKGYVPGPDSGAYVQDQAAHVQERGVFEQTAHVGVVHGLGPRRATSMALTSGSASTLRQNRRQGRAGCAPGTVSQAVSESPAAGRARGREKMHQRGHIPGGPVSPAGPRRSGSCPGSCRPCPRPGPDARFQVRIEVAHGAPDAASTAPVASSRERSRRGRSLPGRSWPRR